MEKDKFAGTQSGLIHSGLSRRQMLSGLLSSVGCGAGIFSLSSLEYVLAAPAKSASGNVFQLSFYNLYQYRLLLRLADMIIPQTDTPGALAVGVPLLMDNLYGQWASAKSKTIHLENLTLIDNALEAIGGEPLLDMNADKQVKTVSALDSQAFETPNGSLQGYIEVKTLIARFYYLSEQGATKELRYYRIPGRWEGCIPFKDVGRTWAR